MRSTWTRLRQGMPARRASAGAPVALLGAAVWPVVLWAALVPAPARAEPASSSDDPRAVSESPPPLSWRAPPDCVAEDALLRRVRANLRPELVPPGRRLAGDVRAEPGQFIVTFTVVEDDRVVGRRVLELSVEECSDVTESVELVAAMLLEGGLSEEERRAHAEAQKEIDDEAQPAPPAEPPEGDSAPAISEGEPDQKIRFSMTAAFSLGLEMAPKLAPGGFLEAALKTQLPIWVALQGAVWGRTWSPPSGSGAEAGVQVWSVAALACGGPVVLGVEWSACAGWAHFFQVVETRGISVPTDASWDQSSALFSLRAGGGLTGSLGWTLGFRLDLPFERARYFAEGPSGAEELFLSGSVYPSTFAGISWTF